MSDTRSNEEAVALGWFDGHYSQERAQLMAELQGLSFENVVNIYANYYHKTESLSNG